MQLIGISGSLRSESINTKLLHSLSGCSPYSTKLDVVTLREIPLYNGDLEEQSGVPSFVIKLQKRIQSAQGVIVAMPEYNAGMPGVLKNALDWLTRPPKEMGPTFAGRPLALAGATPGGLGTALAQAGSLVVLRQLKVRLFPDHLRVSSANERFDADGRPDPELAKQLTKWLQAYVQFIQS